MLKVMVVEDDPIQRELLEEVLKASGYDVVSVSNAEKAERIFKEESIDIVVTDVKLPGKSGIELLKKVKEIDPFVEVIVITAFSTVEDAVKAIKIGAFHYVTKPYDIDIFLNLLSKCSEIVSLRKSLKGDSSVIYASPVMEKLLDTARVFAKTDAPILITGESGTGKEVVAKFIHMESGRDGKFVSVNCGAIPENLFESELFGYEKGAFSGAVKSKSGLIEEADRGTLFLDEIGDLPLSLQVKLLRFLQEKKIRRVGGIKEIEVDVRVIAATNKDLEALVREGKFREDLFYRLNVLRLTIPPLRERKEDIGKLTLYFVDKYGKKYEKSLKVSQEALELLLNYDFPGNVRELENIIHRAVLIAAKEIRKEHLGIFINDSGEDSYKLKLPEGKKLPEFIGEIEKKLIERALEEADFVQTKAAKILGIDEKSLRYKRKKYGI